MAAAARRDDKSRAVGVGVDQKVAVQRVRVEAEAGRRDGGVRERWQALPQERPKARLFVGRDLGKAAPAALV